MIRFTLSPEPLIPTSLNAVYGQASSKDQGFELRGEQDLPFHEAFGGGQAKPNTVHRSTHHSATVRLLLIPYLSLAPDGFSTGFHTLPRTYAGNLPFLLL